MERKIVCTMFEKTAKGEGIGEGRSLKICTTAGEKYSLSINDSYSVEDGFILLTINGRNFVENIAIPFDRIDNISFSVID